MSQTALKTFIVYAREDKPHLDRFLMHLRILERNGLLDVWHDAEIPVGAHWEQAIKAQLHQADIILILVTVNALNSEFIENEEMGVAFENLRAGTSRVVPVIVDHCLWKDHPKISALQGLPEDMRPVTDSSNPNQVWAAVSEGVRQIALDIQKSRQPAPMTTSASAAPSPKASVPKVEKPPKKTPAVAPRVQVQKTVVKTAPAPSADLLSGTDFSILAASILVLSFVLFFIHYALRVYLSHYLTPGGYWSTLAEMALYSALLFSLAAILVLAYHNWVSQKMTTILMVLVLGLLAVDVAHPFYHWYAFKSGLLKINGVTLPLNTSVQAPETGQKAREIPEALRNAHPAIQELYTFLEDDVSNSNTFSFSVPASSLFVKGYLMLNETLLTDLTNVLKSYPYWILKIEVYSDNLGDPRANKTLTEKRAAALQTRLLSMGIPAAQLECIGLGGISPVATNTEEAGRDQNRRVVFEVRK
jgi:outer membrane protein OmpA-like peptidoglycan-associated protein